MAKYKWAHAEDWLELAYHAGKIDPLTLLDLVIEYVDELIIINVFHSIMAEDGFFEQAED
jgi:hypothetical protein